MVQPASVPSDDEEIWENTGHNEWTVSVPNRPSFLDDFKDASNAPLSEKNIKKITKSVDFLKTFKPSEDCQKEVLNKLFKIGFNLEDFQSFLEKGFNAYDGTKSNITAAGNIRVKWQADEAYGVGATVSDIFKIKVETKIVRGRITTKRS